MQFTNLLEAIPPEIIRLQYGGCADNGGRQGKVSKRDVLELARRYIQTLEREKTDLQGENGEYKKSISLLRAALENN